MKRSFVLYLLAIYLLGSSAIAAAQLADKVGRLGILGFDAVASKPFIEAFRRGLTELGHVEGQNIIIEYRWAEGKPDRLPQLAAELVALKVDVIFAAAAPVIRAAKDATKTTPIVFEMLADPVSAGFVNSLAKPGGNLTGVAGLAPELSGKRLELLKEIVPRLNLVAVLANPGNPNFQSVLKESQRAAAILKLRLQVLEVKKPAMLGPAFAAMVKGGAEAL
ncbi:MAG TPA: ABC transporter substrate-binding protein, partial [Candidatus Binatus sp.]|nr:ABC transporter substrate-binding protein [Candidatus Binatus sp.]